MYIQSLRPSGRKALWMLAGDNGLLYRIPDETVKELHLEEGMELDAAALEGCEFSDTYEATRETGLRMLSARAYGTRELADALTARGYPPAESQQAVQRFCELGLMDDGRYAAELVARAAAQGRSPRDAAYELRRRGLCEETAEKALEAMPDAAGVLDRLIGKRLGGRPVVNRKDREKLCAYLARRGFDWEDINEALQRYQETNSGGQNVL